MTWCIRPRANPKRSSSKVLADKSNIDAINWQDVAFPNEQMANQWLAQHQPLLGLLESYELPPGVSHWTEDTLAGGNGNDILP